MVGVDDNAGGGRGGAATGGPVFKPAVIRPGEGEGEGLRPAVITPEEEGGGGSDGVTDDGSNDRHHHDGRRAGGVDVHGMPPGLRTRQVREKWRRGGGVIYDGKK